jgi:hypothetical protein
MRLSLLVRDDISVYRLTTAKCVSNVDNYLCNNIQSDHYHRQWGKLMEAKTQQGRQALAEARTIYDHDIACGLKFHRKIFFTVANCHDEYGKDTHGKEFIGEVKRNGADVFTFIERKWCHTIQKPTNSWLKSSDNVAILPVTTYDEWWRRTIKTETRNRIRRADKSRVTTEIVEEDEKSAEGIWRIYNETPIRQGRRFPYFGESLETIKRIYGLFPTPIIGQKATVIGAYFQEELIGFLRMEGAGNETAQITNIFSLQQHWYRCPNNALMSKAVEVCTRSGTRWLTYGKMENHPGLDRFKENHGFRMFPVTRYYIPLTTKGKIATALGLHRQLQDILPDPVKHYFVIPVYCWLSRTNMKIKYILNHRAS